MELIPDLTAEDCRKLEKLCPPERVAMRRQRAERKSKAGVVDLFDALKSALEKPKGQP